MKTLNIKNPEAHRLAAAISATTGESMTRVVTDALRERFEHLKSRKRKASVEEMMAIAERVSSRAKDTDPDHTSFLYDENGLPK